jgi:hypothetical protein
MAVSASIQKHKTDDLGDELMISMPSRKRLGFILVLILCNLAWLNLELLIIFLFPYILSQASNLLFLVVWSGIGILVIYPLAWQLFGKEEIQITAQFIKISKVVLGFKRSKEYAADQIDGLYITKFSTSLDTYRPRNGIHQGHISFNYDPRATDQYITFAAGVDELEAQQIFAEIQRKFPQYKKQM